MAPGFLQEENVAFTFYSPKPKVLVLPFICSHPVECILLGFHSISFAAIKLMYVLVLLVKETFVN